MARSSLTNLYPIGQGQIISTINIQQIRFLDPFLLDAQDEVAKNAQPLKEIEELLACAKAWGFPEEHWAEQGKIVWDHSSAFRANYFPRRQKSDPCALISNSTQNQ